MLDLSAACATFPVLETERFVLRTVTPGDTDDIFRIMRDPRVTRYFGVAPMVSRAEATRRVQEFRTAFVKRSGIRWGITRRGEERLLGTCGFWRVIPAHFRAEIGYELAPEWWGQGVMPEALGAVMTFGFTRMGLHSVEAHIHPANTGSRRVLEKLGFVQEGYFRDNYYDPAEGQFTDTAVFSLLKATWMRRADAGV